MNSFGVSNISFEMHVVHLIRSRWLFPGIWRRKVSFKKIRPSFVNLSKWEFQKWKNIWLLVCWKKKKLLPLLFELFQSCCNIGRTLKLWKKLCVSSFQAYLRFREDAWNSKKNKHMYGKSVTVNFSSCPPWVPTGISVGQRGCFF